MSGAARGSIARRLGTLVLAAASVGVVHGSPHAPTHTGSDEVRRTHRGSLDDVTESPRLDHDEIHVFTLTLAEDEYAEIDVRQTEADVEIRTFGPDGTPRHRYDSPPLVGGVEKAYLLADTAGDYRIEVGRGGRTAGLYTLERIQRRPGGAVERLRMQAETRFEQARNVRVADPDERRASIAAFEEAAESMSRLGDEVRRIDVEALLAGLYLLERRPADALHLFRRVADEMERSGQRHRLGQSWTSIGWAHDNLGNFQEAIDAYTEARRVYVEIGSEGGIATVDASLGRIHQALGAYDEAVDHHRRAGDRWRDMGFRWADGIAEMHVARAYAAAGDLTSARQELDDAIERLEAGGSARRRGQAQVQRARLARHMGDDSIIPPAIGAAEALAEETGDARLAGEILLERGEWWLAHEDPTAALEEFTAAAERFAGIPDAAGEIAAGYGRARSERAAGRLDEARRTIEATLARVEALRAAVDRKDLRAAYLASTRELYELSVDLIWEEAGAPASSASDAVVDSLLAVVERARARSLLEALPIGPSGDDAAPVGRGPVQSLLNPGEALVLFQRTPHRWLALVLESDGARAVELPVTPGLADTVRNAADLIAGESAAAWQPIARRLGRELLAPLGLRPAVSKVFLAPDDALHFLPFELLPLAADGPLLIERAAVSYIPSASLWSRLRRRPPTQARRAGDVWVFGAPRTAGEDRTQAADASDELPELYRREGFAWAPLPHAATEARAVARILGDGKHVFLGPDASESRVKSADLGSAAVVHFATHGWVTRWGPSRSALVLAADDPGEDGLLRADEILGLQLEAPLVVLSACGTAQGRLRRGEGVEGLVQAFLRAGADGVVATLWPVEDREAAAFIRRFYQGISAGRNEAEALRRAKLATLREDGPGSASIWAAYVLVGGGSEEAPRWAVSRPGRPGVAIGAAALVLAALFGLVAAVRRRSRRPVAVGGGDPRRAIGQEA